MAQAWSQAVPTPLTRGFLRSEFASFRDVVDALPGTAQREVRRPRNMLGLQTLFRLYGRSRRKGRAQIVTRLLPAAG